jgi:hypothetical protein
MRQFLRVCAASSVVALGLSATAAVAAPMPGSGPIKTEITSNLQPVRWTRVCDRFGHHCHMVWHRDVRHFGYHDRDDRRRDDRRR